MDKPATGDVNLLTESARDALDVRRVFGEAYERDGVTVIPVAKIMGGSGMGYGSGAMGDAETSHQHRPGTGEGSGGGGGFAVRARPVGVYVLKDGNVSWQPSLDLNRIIFGGQILGAVAVVALSWALRRRRFVRRG
ncbi:sporulation protein [Georgenia yuyongxinii]|uniref:Sporulation protein n=1 Tax=Georgenia yuyongxinii TaxID=2589797 RepID=A0A5B8C7U0_9MICO|nr:spore germination protein GerW family protein [Georgenia yuyongxinii]QDC23996.1 sporulation protein [Georgenia yuyongxinii]